LEVLIPCILSVYVFTMFRQDCVVAGLRCSFSLVDPDIYSTCWSFQASSLAPLREEKTSFRSNHNQETYLLWKYSVH
jgi:hypothetical protein